MKSSIAAILKRIRVHGRGWIFTPRHFVGLGSQEAIAQALVRLTRDGIIRRLLQGIYEYPRTSKRFGMLAPDPDKVAAAWARNTGRRLQVSGARAANLLGLTKQVPAQLVYLTDGAPRKIKLGPQLIHLKRASPAQFPGAGTAAGLAIQALRAVGPSANKDFVFQQLSRALCARDKLQLIRLRKHAPGWSQDVIQRLKGT